jgi:hypothetical protein
MYRKYPYFKAVSRKECYIVVKNLLRCKAGHRWVLVTGSWQLITALSGGFFVPAAFFMERPLFFY